MSVPMFEHPVDTQKEVGGPTFPPLLEVPGLHHHEATLRGHTPMLLVDPPTAEGGTRYRGAVVVVVVGTLGQG